MKFVKRGTVMLLITMAVVFFTAFLTGQPALARSPEVDDHYPDGGDRDVPIGVTIWVEFDQHMDKDTVIDGMTLRDENGRDVSGKVSYNDKERRAYFKPSKKLEYETRYRVRLSSSIEDISGDNIRSYTFYFTTMKYPVLVVNGMDVPEQGLNVNTSPVNITVDAPGAKEVVFGSESLERRVRSYYLNNYHLKPGKNNLSFKVVYEYEDEKGKTKQETLSLSRSINLVNTLDEGAVITHDLSKSNKISYFDKRLNIVLPGGFYLRHNGVAAGSQLLAFKAERAYSVNGNPVVSYLFNVAHLPDKDDGYTEDSFRDKITGIDVPPGGQISLPVDGDLTEAAYRTITVFYDQHDGIPGNWVNLGGRTDASKKTITVPFKGLGRYVVVNKVITFGDFEAAGSARHCVEYLWAKGIMQPAENAPPGYLGLVSQSGTAVSISRGEFVE